MDTLRHILGAVRALKPPAHVRPPPISEAVWSASVGSRIAQRAQPLRLQAGVLWVRVATAPWANELSLLADDILAQLRQRRVDVKSLRFSVGEVQVPVRRRPVPVRAAPSKAPPLPERLAKAMSGLGDAPLRDAVADAAAKALSILR